MYVIQRFRWYISPEALSVNMSWNTPLLTPMLRREDALQGLFGDCLTLHPRTTPLQLWVCARLAQSCFWSFGNLQSTTRWFMRSKVLGRQIVVLIFTTIFARIFVCARFYWLFVQVVRRLLRRFGASSLGSFTLLGISDKSANICLNGSTDCASLPTFIGRTSQMNTLYSHSGKPCEHEFGHLRPKHMAAWAPNSFLKSKMIGNRSALQPSTLEFSQVLASARRGRYWAILTSNLEAVAWR